MNLIDLIFPKRCLSCQEYGKYICRNCAEKVRKSKWSCPECNSPSIDGFTHVKCQKKLGLNGLLSIWNYDGVVRKALIALKYKFADEVSKELVSYVVTELENNKFLLPTGYNANAVPSSAYCLVPVPLHWYRENYRGFNQSYLLGSVVAKECSLKFMPDMLIRKKFVPPQVGLKGNDRKSNVRGVFAFNSSAYKLAPSACILFDDVYTTGSTLKEACKVLKRNGVEKVWGLTVAR